MRTILCPDDLARVGFLVVHETSLTRREITEGHRGRHLAPAIDCDGIHRMVLVYKDIVHDGKIFTKNIS